MSESPQPMTNPASHPTGRTGGDPNEVEPHLRVSLLRGPVQPLDCLPRTWESLSLPG